MTSPTGSWISESRGTVVIEDDLVVALAENLEAIVWVPETRRRRRGAPVRGR